MNIAILIPALGGGGAERIASSIGDYFTELGHNVYYLLSGYNIKSRYKVKGTIIHTGIKITGTEKYQEILDLFKSAVIIRKYKKQYKIDVSISFMEESNYINVLSKWKDKVIVRVCTILSKRRDLGDSIVYNKNLIRHIYNRANAVIVMTKYAKEELVNDYRIRRKKIAVIQNPASRLQESREERWLWGSRCIICIGRLEGVKQHNVAVRAFNHIHKDIPDAQLLLLGEGANNKKIKKLIKSLNLESNVHLLGFQKDIGYYLEHAKVCMVTSKAEGFHIGMVEAMSKGVPVVSTNCPGGPPEILGGETDNRNLTIMCPYGILTPYIDTDSWNENFITAEELELAKAVKALLQDEQLYQRYRKAALKRAQMYSFKYIAGRWQKLLNKVAGNRGGVVHKYERNSSIRGGGSW